MTTCPCGFEFLEGGIYDTGLLKPLRQQVDLEEQQAIRIAHFIEGDETARADWICHTHSSEYPFESNKELIEDFLYASNRHDGYTATLRCPLCKRLGLLFSVDADWQWFRPEPPANAEPVG